jgi:hypothetical protein
VGICMCYHAHMGMDRIPSYGRLCDRVRELGGTIQLSREDDWGLLVTLPGQCDSPARACGFLLGDVSELELVAPLLLAWVLAPEEDDDQSHLEPNHIDNE